MGLDRGDLEKVPKSLTVDEAYERIYVWHNKFGKQKLEQKKLSKPYRESYLKLLGKIPSASKATQADKDFVFEQVISGLMEWAYHESDEHGIKTAAYAHFSLNRTYKNGFSNEEFRKSAGSSGLK